MSTRSIENTILSKSSQQKYPREGGIPGYLDIDVRWAAAENDSTLYNGKQLAAVRKKSDLKILTEAVAAAASLLRGAARERC